jgi:hypothetical protein
MKLQLFRDSGFPVSLADRDGYDADFRLMYDKTEAKAAAAYERRTAKGPSYKGYNVPKMIIFNRMLAYGERLLIKKWSKNVEIELPRSKTALIKLLSTYEDVPIMLALSVDRKSVIAVLMDQLQ